MIAIKNATLVMRDHLIPEAVLFVEDGKITGFGEMRTTPIPENCEIIDAQNQFVGPGLVDIHCHAGDCHWFNQEPLEAAKYHLSHGTTSILATLYFDTPKADLLKQTALVQAAMKQPEGTNIVGIYMEAPYMNPKFGANRVNNPWKGPICKEDYQELIEAAGNDVRVWVVAPERENIESFVQYAKACNPNVRFAVGHSEASPQQIEALMPYGLCIGTHHTNATGTIINYPGCRGVCVDETVNYNRDIYAEMICDSRGIHVDPYMQRLIRKIKGDDRLILISDACWFQGSTPEDYIGVTDLCFDFQGQIAGSKLTLDVACRNMMKHTGASIVDVFKFASYNPSRAVGFLDRGEIAVGKRADLVFVDPWMNIQRVILNGVVKQ
ncbi:MAG: amidohydrolase family protein [Oscillospiraceae bacterium]|nr:amidohydrolase family protein [Oscillospiraceae bacterium]